MFIVLDPSFLHLALLSHISWALAVDCRSLKRDSACFCHIWVQPDTEAKGRAENPTAWEPPPWDKLGPRSGSSEITAGQLLGASDEEGVSLDTYSGAQSGPAGATRALGSGGQREAGIRHWWGGAASPGSVKSGSKAGLSSPSIAVVTLIVCNVCTHFSCQEDSAERLGLSWWHFVRRREAVDGGE